MTRSTITAKGDSLAKSVAFGIPLAAIVIGSLSMLSEGNFRRTASAEYFADYEHTSAAAATTGSTAMSTETATATTGDASGDSNKPATGNASTETLAATKLASPAVAIANPGQTNTTKTSTPAASAPAGNFRSSKSADPTDGRFLRPSNAGIDNCATCHQVQNGMSHPVGVTPSMRVPESLPLAAGRVACITCHDPQAAADHAGRKPSGRAYLREEDKLTSMCAQCHTPDTTRGTSHGSARIKAHNSNMPSGVNAKMAGHSAGMDSESRTCMACHDGGTAADAGSHSRLSMNPILSSEHPIGVKYEPHPARASDEIKLKPIRSIDRRVRLFNERIGCGSCHSVYGGEKKLLVMNNLNSRLCLACHDQ